MTEGWYADPAGEPGLQRWWDGATWTGQTRPTQSASAGPGANPLGLAPLASDPLSAPLPRDKPRVPKWVLGAALAAGLAGVLYSQSGTNPRATPLPPTPTLPSASPSESMTQFQDPGSGIKLLRPAGWVAAPGGAAGQTAFLIPGTRGASVSVSTQNSGTASLEAYTMQAVTTLQTQLQPQGLTQRRVMLGGQSATELDYVAARGNRGLHLRSTITLKGGRAVILTLSADPTEFDRLLPQYTALVSSVTLG